MTTVHAPRREVLGRDELCGFNARLYGRLRAGRGRQECSHP